MKKLLIYISCFILSGCDNSKSDADIVKTAQNERANAIAEIENKITPEQRKRNFENRLYDACQNRFAREYVFAYPITYKNRVCICFAEKNNRIRFVI